MDLLARLAELLGLIENPDTIEDPEVIAAELADIFNGIREGVAAGEVELPEGQSVLDTVRPIGEAVINLRALDFLRQCAAADIESELNEIATGLMPSVAADTDADAAAAADPEAAELAAQAAADAEPDPEAAADPPAEPEGGTAAPAADAPAAEPVTASPPPLGAVRRHQPANRQTTPGAPARNPHARLTATQGGEITEADIGRVMYEGFRQMGANAGKRVFVQLQAEYDADHTLELDSAATNGRKLDALTADARGNQAWEKAPVTAAGFGWCVPSPVSYDEVVQSIAVRPVAAALPSVQIDHGGARLPVSPTLSDIQTSQALDAGSAISVWTEANDIAATDNDGGGDDVLKPVQRIDCPDFVDFRAYMIVKRLRFGNMATRANPEHFQSWNTLANAAFARVADTKLLDLIKGDAGTTEVVNPTTLLGAVRDWVELVLRLAEYMRNAERATDGMGGGGRIRVMAPSWAIGLSQADLIRTPQFASGAGNLVVPRGDIVQMLTNAGVNPTFYIDSPSTGPTQLLGKQVDGQPALQWPCDIQFGMWFEGHFAHGDLGTQDFGVIRDVSLNEVNDAESFVESTETVLARRGPEALWVTQSLLADGAYAASIDISAELECAS